MEPHESTPGDEAYRFRFHYLDRRNDCERPKLHTSKWEMSLEDARQRVERGEWLVAVPDPHGASLRDDTHGHRSLDSKEASFIVERLIREGKVYGVKPTYDHV